MDKRSDKTMAASAGKVSAATAFSRILGLIREQVVAFFFGAGLATDAFVAAFRIPNLLRDLFAEGALSSAFIPVFKDQLVNRGEAEANRLACLTISLLIVIVGIIVIIGIITTPIIVYISANGFTADPGKFNLTVNLTRLMFVYLLLVSVSAVIMGILNSRGQFGIPALSPAMFNLGMIITPVVLYQYFNIPIYTLAIGVVIGGIGQLVFQLPALFSLGFKFRFIFKLADEGIKRIARLISPMILGLSASRINILVNTLLASMLIEGALSYLNFAYRLMHFPLGVFGVALGTVTLPKASDDVARNNTGELRNTFYEAVGLSMFLVIPSAVYLAGFGPDLVRLIYERGAFDVTATQQTSRALFFYSFGLVGFAGVRVAAPIYYALGDAKKPMYFSILAVVVNIILNFAFIPLWGFAGLAAATSVAGLLNFVLLVANLSKKSLEINYLFIVVKAIKFITAALAAFFVLSSISFDMIFKAGTILDKIFIVFIQIAGMGIIYLGLVWLLKANEINKFLGLFRLKK